MKHNAIITVDIPLPVDVVTLDTRSQAVQKVIEVLLYQRNQIPFCFENFRTIVTKFDKKKATGEAEVDPEWKDYRLVKQRAAALGTLKKIQQLFKELPTITSQGPSVLILFGSTVYTAKEAFQVNLPSVNPHHFPTPHWPTLEKALKKLAMVMTLSEDLQTGSERITGPTRMFLLLNRTETPLPEPCPNWQRMEEFQLPAGCHRHEINLFQSGGKQRLNCCKEITIYEEEGDVDIGQEAMEMDEGSEEDPEELESVAWYLIGEGLKGYKEAEVRGKLIWNCGS